MKEEEAKTKWCPKSIASALEECTMGVTTYTYNRDGTGGIPDECKCIASDCMVWVWEDPSGKRRDNTMLDKSNYGHCGLANQTH